MDMNDQLPASYTFIVTYHFAEQPKPPQGQGQISVSARDEQEARRIAKHRIHDLHKESVGSGQIKIDRVIIQDDPTATD